MPTRRHHKRLRSLFRLLRFRSVLLVFAVAFLQISRTEGLSAQTGEDVAAAYRQGFEALSQQDFQGALPHFEKALELAEQRFGVDNPQTAVELNNLGEVFRLIGDNNRAAAYLERALEIERRHGTPTSKATTMNNLALVYRSLDRLADAQKLYKTSLALLEESLGPNHPDLAKGLNNLAMVYVARGQNDRARSLLERAIRISQGAVGSDHPTTVLLTRNLEQLGGTTTITSSTESEEPTPDDTAEDTPITPADDPAEAQVASLDQGDEHAVPLHFPSLRPQRNSKPLPILRPNKTWFLHLASVRSGDRIAAAWAQIQSTFPELSRLSLKDSQPVEIEGRGEFHRVVAGSLKSLGEAQSICAQLEQIGQYCSVVRPES